MIVNNKGNKGNPNHDEEGKFTTKEGVYSSGFSFDTIDDFLDSFIVDKTIDSQKPIVDFKTTLNPLLTNVKKRDYILDALNQQLNEMPDDFKNVMKTFWEKSKIKLTVKGQHTCFSLKRTFFGSILGGELFIRQKEISENNFNGHMTGTPVIHETFHAIDHLYDAKDGITLSQNYVLSNGKTFREIVDNEFGSLDANKMFDELYNDHEQELISELNKIGITNEVFYKIKNIEKSQDAELKKVNYMLTKNLFPTFEDYSEEFDKIKSYYGKMLDLYSYESKKIDDITKVLQPKYAIMADMCESIEPYNKFTKKLGYGHSSIYWKTSSNQSVELFAECAESLALNKDSLAKIEKYFPNSLNAFKEIFNDLLTGKIQYKGW